VGCYLERWVELGCRERARWIRQKKDGDKKEQIKCYWEENTPNKILSQVNSPPSNP
jgi:hypothetical protein